MAKKKGPPRGSSEARRVEHRAPTFTSLYINDVNVFVTAWDFRLRLGQIESVDKDANSLDVTVLADVRVSPTHMKRLLQILNKQLEAYEAQVGPIALLGESR